MSKLYDELALTVKLFGDMDESEQVDMAWMICQEAREALRNKSELDEGEAEIIQDIERRFLKILGTLLGSSRGVELTMGLRKSTPFRKVLTVEEKSRLIDKGLGPSGKKTRMLLEWEARPFRVEIGGGGFYTRSSGGRLQPFSTLGMESHGKSNFGAFVIGLDLRLYIFNHRDKADRIAHSSFVRGAPVLAAGEIRITNGRLMALTSHSGHYRPDPKAVADTLKFFQSRAVSLTHALVFFVVDPKIDAKSLPLDQIPFIFLSDRNLLTVVKGLIKDDLESMQDGPEKKQRMLELLHKDSLVQVELGKFVYTAKEFLASMKRKEKQAEEELEKLLGF